MPFRRSENWKNYCRYEYLNRLWNPHPFTLENRWIFIIVISNLIILSCLWFKKMCLVVCFLRFFIIGSVYHQFSVFILNGTYGKLKSEYSVINRTFPPSHFEINFECRNFLIFLLEFKIAFQGWWMGFWIKCAEIRFYFYVFMNKLIKFPNSNFITILNVSREKITEKNLNMI